MKPAAAGCFRDPRYHPWFEPFGRALARFVGTSLGIYSEGPFLFVGAAPRGRPSCVWATTGALRSWAGATIDHFQPPRRRPRPEVTAACSVSAPPRSSLAWLRFDCAGRGDFFRPACLPRRPNDLGRGQAGTRRRCAGASGWFRPGRRSGRTARRCPSPRRGAPGGSPWADHQDRSRPRSDMCRTSPGTTPRHCRTCRTGPRHSAVFALPGEWYCCHQHHCLRNTSRSGLCSGRVSKTIR
jgi:hypothetical protein